MIRVSPGHTVVAFPQRYEGREVAARVEIRDKHNRITARLWTGPTLADAWDTAERHIAAVEAERQEVAA